MKFRLVESYKYSKIFGDKETAEWFKKENVRGFSAIEEGEDNTWIVRYDELKGEVKPLDIWGDSKSHNDKFVSDNRNLLAGMKVYYLTFPNGKPITERGHVIYYKNKKDASDRIKYHNSDNLQVREYQI